MRIQTLTEETKKNLLEDLLRRSPNQYTEYEERVADILYKVRKERDKAVFEYTKMFMKGISRLEKKRLQRHIPWWIVLLWKL